MQCQLNSMNEHIAKNSEKMAELTEQFKQFNHNIMQISSSLKNNRGRGCNANNDHDQMHFVSTSTRRPSLDSTCRNKSLTSRKSATYNFNKPRGLTKSITCPMFPTIAKKASYFNYRLYILYLSLITIAIMCIQ